MHPGEILDAGRGIEEGCKGGMLAGVCMASDKPLLRDVRDILSARNLDRILLGYRFFEQVDWEFCFFFGPICLRTLILTYLLEDT